MGRVLQILGVLRVVGFAGFFAYDALVNAPKAQAHLGQLEQEAEQIPAPSWARELSRSAGNKRGFALLDRTYIARASYAEIRAFYDNALARSDGGSVPSVPYAAGAAILEAGPVATRRVT